MILDYDHRELLKVGEERGWFTMTQQVILRNAASSLFDRTTTVDTGVPLTLLDRIPQGTTDKSLEEICDDQAQRIKALGKPVTVLWSGGIDSTLALISLIKADVPDITVSMSGASVLEYPKFYREHIHDKLNVRRTRPNITESLKYDEVIVTGEFGDQISGSVAMFSQTFKSVDLREECWKKVVSGYTGKRFVELFEPQTAHAPFPIVTTFDFLWWLNFSCKWQNVLLRMGGLTMNPLEFATSVQHFFRHEDFQRWSMDYDNHKQHKFTGAPNTYKQHMKDIIGAFTKDDDYRVNKLKVGSLRDRIPFLFKLADGRVIVDPAEAEQFDDWFILRNFS